MNTPEAKKTVPFVSSQSPRCLQACVEMVLRHLLPEKIFSVQQIDLGTGQSGGTTYLPPAVMFLFNQGLTINLYSDPAMDYREFASKGKNYIREQDQNAYKHAELNGAFLNIDLVQATAAAMVEKNLWKRERYDNNDVGMWLQHSGTLGIAKTFMPWLNGSFVARDPHYVLLIRRSSENTWELHNPGPPPVQYQQVDFNIHGVPMFSEVLIVANHQNIESAKPNNTL